MTERKDEQEAREALARANREAETLGGSSMARAGQRLVDHFTGADAKAEADDGAPDPIEIWGRRIGRGLSLLLFCYLLWELGQTLSAR
jgi:hypothetical protein